MVVALLTRAGDLGLKVAGWIGFLPGLLTRLVVGSTFLQTGGGKIANIQNTVAFFTELGIPRPELNALVVSRMEYWGGLALMLGLLTRLAASGLCATMIVALMTADRATFLTALGGSGEVGLTDVSPVVLALFLLWLMVKGPGALSLDALLSRALGIGAPAQAEARPAG